MYEQHFRLARPPFSLALEPDFLFPTTAHKEALAALAYALTTRKGFVVLTGEVGTGKSTVIRSVLRTLTSRYGDKFRFALVVNPKVSGADLLEQVLWGLGMRDVPAGNAQRLIRFQQFLLQAKGASQICAIIIDEAQQLSSEALEDIRLWTNLETSECKLLQVVLAGQTELDEILSQPKLRQLKQRVAFRIKFAPLAAGEVRSYIDHRWSKAGGELPVPFTPSAIDAVRFWSKGIPRLINSVCDNALLTAFAADAQVVTAAEVNEAAADLDLQVSGAPPAEPEQTVLSESIAQENVTDDTYIHEPEIVRAAAASSGTTVFGTLEQDGMFKRLVVRLGLGRSQ